MKISAHRSLILSYGLPVIIALAVIALMFATFCITPSVYQIIGSVVIATVCIVQGERADDKNCLFASVMYYLAGGISLTPVAIATSACTIGWTVQMLY